MKSQGNSLFELVVELLSKRCSLVLDRGALVFRLLKLEEHGVRCRRDRLGALQAADDAAVAAGELLPEELELHGQVADGRVLGLGVVEEVLFSRVVRPLRETVPGRVVDEVFVLAVVHSRGVARVAVAERLLVAVLEVGRLEVRLRLEVPHQPSGAVLVADFAVEEVPDGLLVSGGRRAAAAGVPRAGRAAARAEVL